MLRVTNLVLIISLFLVLLLIGLAFFASESDSGLGKFFAFVVLLSGLTFLAYRRTEKNVNKKNSFWLMPVTPKVGNIIVNGVVLLWLIVVLVITGVIVVVEKSLEFTAISAFIIISALIFGKYMKKRFFSGSLLSYGISFFFALLMIVTALVGFSKNYQI